jgi:GGDEF domain-containing protein
MEPQHPQDALTHFRNGYLKLRSVLHDRTTRFPAYTMLFDELRTLLDARRHLGVVHIEPGNIDLVESLYGWQVFDRTMAQLAAIVKAMPGHELPAGALLAVGDVPADRFVAFIPESHDGHPPTHDDMAALAAAVKVRLDEAMDAEPFLALAPRLSVRTGHAFLSEDPFYRFERRVRAAVEDARTLPDRRERSRERAGEAHVERQCLGEDGEQRNCSRRQARCQGSQTPPLAPPVGSLPHAALLAGWYPNGPC